jgi:hypothetical protein
MDALGPFSLVAKRESHSDWAEICSVADGDDAYAMAQGLRGAGTYHTIERKRPSADQTFLPPPPFQFGMCSSFGAGHVRTSAATALRTNEPRAPSSKDVDDTDRASACVSAPAQIMNDEETFQNFWLSIDPHKNEEKQEMLLGYLAAGIKQHTRDEVLLLRAYLVWQFPPSSVLDVMLEVMDGHLAMRQLIRPEPPS